MILNINMSDIPNAVAVVKRLLLSYIQTNYMCILSKYNTCDIGSFKNARLIGFGFPMISTRKIWQARVFNTLPSFPSTILTSDSNKKIETFFEEKPEHCSYIVYKSDRGCVGYGIKLFNSFQEFQQLKPSLYDGILQYSVEPLLHKNLYKFDARSIIVFLKDFVHQKYYAYYFDQGDWVKICNKIYDPTENNKKGFLTNVGFNHLGLENIKMMDSFLDENFKHKSSLMKNKYHNLILDIAKIRLKRMKMDNDKFFANRSVQCKNQIWISGSDIIFDKNGNPFFLELNGRPGIIEHDDIPVLYFMTVELIKDIYKYIFDPWIQNKGHVFHESKLCKLLCAESF